MPRFAVPFCGPYPTLLWRPPAPCLLQCVEESDVIFAASGSEELLVHREDIESMPPASDKVRCSAPRCARCAALCMPRCAVLRRAAPRRCDPVVPLLACCVPALPCSSCRAPVLPSGSGSHPWREPGLAEPRPGNPSPQVGGVRRFVDISVPRNIAHNINELTGKAIVYNVDDLKEVRRPNIPFFGQISLSPVPGYCSESRLGCAASLPHPGCPPLPTTPPCRRRPSLLPLKLTVPCCLAPQVVAANKEERARAAAEAEVLLQVGAALCAQRLLLCLLRLLLCLLRLLSACSGSASPAVLGPLLEACPALPCPPLPARPPVAPLAPPASC